MNQMKGYYYYFVRRTDINTVVGIARVYYLLEMSDRNVQGGVSLRKKTF